jgi:hypothetical protein
MGFERFNYSTSHIKPELAVIELRDQCRSASGLVLQLRHQEAVVLLNMRIMHHLVSQKFYFN